jgi:PAS domain S-box-containing protein
MESLSKERVLLVDDEPQVLVALEDLLCDKFDVLKAESAEHALDVIGSERDIAVVITDQRMPRMTGDELLVKLAGSTDATRIMVTGFADLSSVIRAVNDGKIFAYITKPWNAQDLQLKVDKAVEHFRLVKELAYERQLLHDLMENIPDGIYFKDRDLRFVRANRPFASMLSASEPDALVGQTLEQLRASNAHGNGSAVEEQRLVNQGTPILDEVHRYQIEGKPRWFSETKAPVRNAQGKVIGLVGISRDVTERIQTSEALRISEELHRKQTLILQSVLDSMGEGVIVTDRAGKSLVWNRRAEKILGSGPLGHMPHDWAEAYGVFSNDRKTPVPAAENPLVRAMAGEEVAETELFIKNPRVEGTSVAVTASPLRNDQGTLLGGIALIRDVTGQRKLEQQLLQSQKMEAVGQLAGGVAHDFNNLLVVIESYSDFVLEALPPGEPMRDDIEEILAAARRASSLTRQLLAFSRRQIFQIKALDLNDVVSNVQKMLQRLIGENIDLVTVLDPRLAMTKADAGQLEQIIVNLAVNARDAMPRGGRLTIETCNTTVDALDAASCPGLTPGDYVMLSVSDTGVGMDTATQKRIFEPFFTTKEVGKGTGLGLSTVYGIVQQSGAHIFVYSEIDRGTSFKIYFPKVQQPAEARVTPKSKRRGSSGAETILLVEDDEAVRNLVVRVLRHHGYTVLAAARAGEARTICSERGTNIDLLLTDVVMPETSGPTLAAELTEHRPGMRVLFMSGYSGGVLEQGGALRAGVPYLEKPFAASSLAEKVRTVLDAAH